ncbi:MAG: SpoIIE family protein phosphatase [Halorhodospira sp.]
MPDESSPTLLVADDEPVNTMLLEAILGARGFHVISAADGEEAVARFREQPVDMVLMDIMMPRMDGYEATRRIKAMDPEGFVPVLFVTALTDEQRLAQCIEAGGEDFVTKPISRVQLNAKIDAWLRTRALYHTIVAQRDALRNHQERLEREQETAERIVARATASAALEAPGLRYYYRPAAILSGDILLAARRPNGNLLVLIGDFTGHGIGAAVGVPGLASVFYDRVARGAHPAELLDDINEKLFRSLPADMFLTAALLEVDFTRACLGVWNAGMPPVWLIRSGEVVATFPSEDLPLGVIRDTAPGRRQMTYRTMPPGAWLYACSDGIVEAVDAAGQLFGAEQVERVLTRSAPEAGFDELLTAVSQFRKDDEQRDDTTLVAVELDRLLTEGGGRGYGAGMAENWHSELVLDAATLAHVNPVPPIMNLLSDLGALEEDRQSLYVVVAELFTNALEHGVLQLDSSLKRGEAGFEAYYRERVRALEALECGEIRLRVQCDGRPEVGRRIFIEVEDSGPGFDYQAILEGGRLDGNPLPAGRGILLVRSLCDEVVYFPPGNRVRVRYSASSGGAGAVCPDPG